MNILLQILEDGRLTDSQGRTVNFKNSVIIMTSNIGAKLITERKKLGFSNGENFSDEEEYKEIKVNVLNEVKKEFKPEFLNRIDELIIFHKLNKIEIRKIIDFSLNKVLKRLNMQNYFFAIDDSVRDLIERKGTDNNYGARPIRRAIQNYVENRIAELILDGKIKKNEKNYIYVENDVVCLKKKETFI